MIIICLTIFCDEILMVYMYKSLVINVIKCTVKIIGQENFSGFPDQVKNIFFLQDSLQHILRFLPPENENVWNTQLKGVFSWPLP